ncbi:MAG: hypothetical protein Q4G43_13045, partial [Mobilicoccus sp.]|nr:hypothetical protein [Mobilicoccus sp.]
QILRIYTIHPPHMYTELKAYNEAHPQAPLYLVHGIYLPDESYIETQDLFEETSTQAMIDEVRDASAAVHGTLERDRTPGRASGTWTADVSPWTAAWIVGVEWDPIAGSASDEKNANAPAHEGTYFSSHPDASPTERWIAARMDELAGYEAARGVSVPIAHANWPTTDPLDHPDEPLESEDMLGVDANHVVPSAAWPGGTFASYHAYPYYPDFQMIAPGYADTDDPYRAYLLDLARHHAGMPVLISEYGVPSSLGSAHRGSHGRDQGHLTEQTAMRMGGEMLRMFADAGLAGGVVFAWTDEWFKFTWNTLPRHAPVHSERRALWHDPFTNEQFFGVVAHDPVRAGRRVLFESQVGVRWIGLDHDASWVHLDLLLDRPGEPMSIGFSIVPDGGLVMPDGAGEAVHDVAVTLDSQAGTARALVRPELDPVRMDGLPASAVPAPEISGWVLHRLTLNRPLTVPTTGEQRPAEFLDVGELIEGDWDADPGNTLATWRTEDHGDGTVTLHLRLPWGMLLLADPSSHTAVVPRRDGPEPTGDVQWEDQPEGVEVKAITATVFVAGTDPIPVELAWDNWNQAQYTERLKAGADELGRAFVETRT